MLKQAIDQAKADSFQGQDIPWLLTQWAERAPDKVAMVWAPFEGPERSLTYRALLQEAGAHAAGLAERGVKPGDFILIHLITATSSLSPG